MNLMTDEEFTRLVAQIVAEVVAETQEPARIRLILPKVTIRPLPTKGKGKHRKQPPEDGVVAGHGRTATAGHGRTATAGDRGTATAGDWGTATAGDWGKATAGYGGKATAGDRGTATAGDWGTATAGDWGKATAGDWGKATAGHGGTLIITWLNKTRYRIAVAYVGENGIKPNTPYKLDGNGNFVEVTK